MDTSGTEEPVPDRKHVARPLTRWLTTSELTCPSTSPHGSPPTLKGRSGAGFGALLEAAFAVKLRSKMTEALSRFP